MNYFNETKMILLSLRCQPFLLKENVNIAAKGNVYKCNCVVRRGMQNYSADNKVKENSPDGRGNVILKMPGTVWRGAKNPSNGKYNPNKILKIINRR